MGVLEGRSSKTPAVAVGGRGVQVRRGVVGVGGTGVAVTTGAEVQLANARSKMAQPAIQRLLRFIVIDGLPDVSGHSQSEPPGVIAGELSFG